MAEPKIFNLFDEISPELDQWLNEKGEVLDLDANSVIVNEGEIIDFIFLLLEGELAINTTDESGNTQCLAKVKRGTVVGEMSWLERRPPVANIVSTTKGNGLKLYFNELDSLITSNPVLAREWQYAIAKKLALQINSQNAWIHRFNGTNKTVEPLRKVFVLFAELNDQDVNILAQIGSLKRIAPGGTLINQGEDVPSLFLLLAGEADIFVNIEGVNKNVGSSRRGELLGELTLLIPDAKGATATVKSKFGMEILELNKESLRTKMTENPELGERFYRSLSCMLSQRSRDQLIGRGLASRSDQAEKLHQEDELNFGQLSTINSAGQRFSRLCKHFQTNSDGIQ